MTHAAWPATSGLRATSIVILTPSISVVAVRTEGSTSMGGSDPGSSKPGPRSSIGGIGTGVAVATGADGSVVRDGPGPRLLAGWPVGATGSGPSTTQAASVTASASTTTAPGRIARNGISTPRERARGTPSKRYMLRPDM